jgi:hypothetical protein
MTDDVAEIRSVIARQFESIGWNAGRSPDWSAFEADFLGEARLVPAARPVKTCTLGDFVERMSRVAANDLASLEETLLGADIRVFGNVAVALAVCAISENDAVPERGVEALLLVKDGGRWRIAGQAWDMEGPDKPVPDSLIDGR